MYLKCVVAYHIFTFMIALNYKMFLNVFKQESSPIIGYITLICQKWTFHVKDHTIINVIIFLHFPITNVAYE